MTRLGELFAAARHALVEGARTPAGELLLVVLLGLAVALATAALLAWVVARLPADYFARPVRRPGHPVLAALLLLARNAGGAALLLLGAALALPGVPGPGVAIALFGFLLLDFPGKRRWQRALLSRPAVRRTLDGLRARAGQPPLDLMEPDEDAGQRGPS